MRLRQEAIDGKTGKAKKKDDMSLCDAIKGIIIIAICVGGYLACKSDDIHNKISDQTKPVQTLTNKRCEQIFKDEGYYYAVRTTCAALENGDEFYNQSKFVDPLLFSQYSRKNNCPLTDDEAFKIKNNTQMVINQKIQESRNETGNFDTFCEEQKSYFGKVVKKYDIK
ncbi:MULTISPECIES: hypothetical protein [unclassified Pasteurella]|uniref:hypothetical protein n=1 Tax=unclassified Pasteurella TaxID=2621516 RepID=UPI0010731EC0|nr:hypothetical protein [Pasteurella sp. 19428wF3_WM03]TFU50277.1 hypothetical protein E4T92_09110 [Pasteurella sp. WM03]